MEADQAHRDHGDLAQDAGCRLETPPTDSHSQEGAMEALIGEACFLNHAAEPISCGTCSGSKHCQAYAGALANSNSFLGMGPA